MCSKCRTRTRTRYGNILSTRTKRGCLQQPVVLSNSKKGELIYDGVRSLGRNDRAEPAPRGGLARRRHSAPAACGGCFAVPVWRRHSASATSVGGFAVPVWRGHSAPATCGGCFAVPVWWRHSTSATSVGGFAVPVWWGHSAPATCGGCFAVPVW